VAAQASAPGRIDALMTRADVYAGAGDWDHALADYGEVVKLDPKQARGHAGIAETLASKGDLPGGIAAFGRALEIAPTEASFWARRCWMRTRLGRELDAALSDCQHALELQPGADYLLGGRAFVYLARKNYALAIADYDADLHLLQPGLPADPYALYGRGLAKLRLGNREGGQSDMAAARAIEPKIGAEYASWGFKP
jgi:tetratricopeptide (TPR) repeat protein